MSYCLTASCLAHREPVFWQPPWGCWVHTAGCQPCGALSGEPDPTALHCRYCGARVQADGAGRLREFAGSRGHWERELCPEHGPGCVSAKAVWRDDSYSDKCPISPTFRHEIGRLALHVSQADRLG